VIIIITLGRGYNISDIKIMLKAIKNKLRRESESLKICRSCFSFYYDNAWHFEKPNYLRVGGADEQITVEFSQCPACVEEALAVYDMEYA